MLDMQVDFLRKRIAFYRSIIEHSKCPYIQAKYAYLLSRKESEFPSGGKFQYYTNLYRKCRRLHRNMPCFIWRKFVKGMPSHEWEELRREYL